MAPKMDPSTRDVYAEQQQKRRPLGGPISPVSRFIVTGLLALVVLIGVYSLSSMASWAYQNVIGMATEETVVPDGAYETLDDGRFVLDANGNGTIEPSERDGFVYTRYQDLLRDYNLLGVGVKKKVSLGDVFREPSGLTVLLSLGSALLVVLLFWLAFWRDMKVQSAHSETEDINQYSNDARFRSPLEIQSTYDIAPDAGYHYTVNANSILGHYGVSNQGLDKIEVYEGLYEDTPISKKGHSFFQKLVLKFRAWLKELTSTWVVLQKIRARLQSEVQAKVRRLQGGEEGYSTQVMDRMDEGFTEALFDASQAPVPEAKRIHYNPRKIPYNPGGTNRDKLKFETWADVINEDWTLPEYELQRAGGVYLVDTGPVNTMVIAMTRAGKGQTYIEPTIDLWMRQHEQQNMVINDPKGELLTKFYVPGTLRGYTPVQFNLINPIKTDIYNPLGLASDAAREGDTHKAATYVENMANVFFPLKGGDDPVWPNAANNAFKRAAYGLIDYYLEEERELRTRAKELGTPPKVLEAKIDQMWGKVTLYNAYQLFVQLTAKKRKDPLVVFQADQKAGKFEGLSPAELKEKQELAEKQSVIWDGASELDLLSLYFNATDLLPKNAMRTLVSNVNNALKSMAGAEKMMASVYGIAITAMSFFTDPTISRLTSGTPSQNVDLAGVSFPRRFGVRFHSTYMENLDLTGLNLTWTCYEDPEFLKPLGEGFTHDDQLDKGWARAYFKGIFPNDVAYLKLELRNLRTKMLVKTFYFKFEKSHQMSLDARYYLEDPILGEKIVKDGILTELIKVPGKENEYQPGTTTFPNRRLMPKEGGDERDMKVEVLDEPAIIGTSVRYTEKPKMIFFVTPPHLMKYAQLILVLLNQLVNMNFDQSYMTEKNQKPHYKTRFMLDEVGNLQSDGHGIDNFETMLSIGLGQDQQFTLILQTLQQLEAVYGENIGKVLQGNVASICFLKSTDDTLLKTLETMSGTVHRTFRDSKNVTRDVQKIWRQNEGKVSYSISTKEQPLVTYNDLMNLKTPGEMIVYRAGESVIWNRQDSVMPMAWRLHQKLPSDPDNPKGFDLKTLPTLSTAQDFDLRKNQPDFVKMVNKRIEQATIVKSATESFQTLLGYTDLEIQQLDPEDYSETIMDLIRRIQVSDAKADGRYDEDSDELDQVIETKNENEFKDEPNVEQEEATKQIKREYLVLPDDKRFAEKSLSPRDLWPRKTDQPSTQYNDGILIAFQQTMGEFQQDDLFDVRDDGLYSHDGTCFIKCKTEALKKELVETLQDAQDQGQRVRGGVPSENGTQVSYEVTSDFIKFLAEQDAWDFANGAFDQAMANHFRG